MECPHLALEQDEREDLVAPRPRQVLADLFRCPEQRLALHIVSGSSETGRSDRSIASASNGGGAGRRLSGAIRAS